MSRDVSLQALSRYITDNISRIERVRREVEEIQLGFNSAYVEWVAKHDAALAQLVEEVVDRLEGTSPASAERVGEALAARIGGRRLEEHSIIAERRQELRSKLIPEAQSEADSLLQEGQRLEMELRKLNPRLDQREEELKVRQGALQQELGELNQRISDLSGCLGVVVNVLRISRLTHRRQRVIGELTVIQQELARVREEWQEARAQTRAQQEGLQIRWQEITLRVARLQGELEYLDDDANCEATALQRAVRYVIDNLNEPVPCPDANLKRELDVMTQLNNRTDSYQEGLGSVGSLIALLDGVGQGLGRFGESIQGLTEEQRMHSSYLPELRIRLPDQVLAFHEQWEGLDRKVRDDRRLCAQPAEFVAAIRPVLQDGLSEDGIRTMFEGLGQALERATSQWRSK